MLNVEEFKFTDSDADTPIPGIDMAIETIAYNEGRAGWGQSEIVGAIGANGTVARPPAGWTQQSRDAFRLLSATYGTEPFYQEQAVLLLLKLRNNKGLCPYTKQSAQTRIQGLLNAPWFPIVRVGLEDGRASRIQIIGTVCSEQEVDRLGKHETRDSHTNEANLKKI